MKYIRLFIGCVWTIGIGCLSPAKATQLSENHPILIVSSYNPEATGISGTISDFWEEYETSGGTSSIIIENMNCKSLADVAEWKGRLQSIFDKYRGNRSPEMVIFLGLEAWVSYISHSGLRESGIPVLCSMVNENIVLLPDTIANPGEWEPESIDWKEAFGNQLPLSGFIYNHDVATNIETIRRLYPQMRSIAFISDNSYRGLALQAHVKKEMKRFPELELILIDGRKHTIYTALDAISRLPENTAILLGNWWVDRNEGYFIRNATYSMMSANPFIPAFSLTTAGLGHWTIGGFLPDYQSAGKELAHMALKVQQNGDTCRNLVVVPNRYVFDVRKLAEFNVSENLLPEGAVLLNKEQTFWQEYRYYLWVVGILFLVLLLGLVMALWYSITTKHLKDKLLVSERHLLAAKEKAEESDHLKSAFLSNMSHEIRTPLNAIVGFAEVLASGESLQEEQEEYSEIIRTNSDLLLRLINDVLDISRLETGKLKFTYERCDVVALCKKVLSTTDFSKKERVEYILAPCAPQYYIETDSQRLQQVLINLLNNANKFTLLGKITLAIEEDAGGSNLVFSVTDTGNGIPEEKQDKVFERFEKLDEYTQGTGLGLAICKITVELLGGKIWIDKSYKSGTRFLFSHPKRYDAHSPESN